MTSYYIIHDTKSKIWDVLCRSYEEALGHVIIKITQMNNEFRKDNPEWHPGDFEYTPGIMEDDCFDETSDDPDGSLVANFSDYDIQFYIKKVYLNTKA